MRAGSHIAQLCPHPTSPPVATALSLSFLLHSFLSLSFLSHSFLSHSFLSLSLCHFLFCHTFIFDEFQSTCYSVEHSLNSLSLSCSANFLPPFTSPLLENYFVEHMYIFTKQSIQICLFLASNPFLAESWE